MSNSSRRRAAHGSSGYRNVVAPVRRVCCCCIRLYYMYYIPMESTDYVTVAVALAQARYSACVYKIYKYNALIHKYTRTHTHAQAYKHTQAHSHTPCCSLVVPRARKRVRLAAFPASFLLQVVWNAYLSQHHDALVERMCAPTHLCTI